MLANMLKRNKKRQKKVKKVVSALLTSMSEVAKAGHLMVISLNTFRKDGRMKTNHLAIIKMFFFFFFFFFFAQCKLFSLLLVIDFTVFIVLQINSDV